MECGARVKTGDLGGGMTKSSNVASLIIGGVVEDEDGAGIDEEKGVNEKVEAEAEEEEKGDNEADLGGKSVGDE